jgi:hypothetical protein
MQNGFVKRPSALFYNLVLQVYVPQPALLKHFPMMS